MDWREVVNTLLVLVEASLVMKPQMGLYHWLWGPLKARPHVVPHFQDA